MVSAVSHQFPVNSSCSREVGSVLFIKGEIFFTVCREIISLSNGILFVYLVTEHHINA